MTIRVTLILHNHEDVMNDNGNTDCNDLNVNDSCDDFDNKYHNNTNKTKIKQIMLTTTLM